MMLSLFCHLSYLSAECLNSFLTQLLAREMVRSCCLQIMLLLQFNMLNHDIFSFFDTFPGPSLPKLKFQVNFSFVSFLTILLTAFGLVCYTSCSINYSSPL